MITFSSHSTIRTSILVTVIWTGTDHGEVSFQKITFTGRKKNRNPSILYLPKAGITKPKESGSWILTKSKKCILRTPWVCGVLELNAVMKYRRSQSYLSKIQNKHFGSILAVSSQSTAWKQRETVIKNKNWNAVLSLHYCKKSIQEFPAFKQQEKKALPFNFSRGMSCNMRLPKHSGTHFQSKLRIIE